MPKIRVLPDILASQVAAGEVVERPASVVKELVENSIDAGAREIFVDIDRGGAGLIRVSDDGCGMSREDAMLSLERHATSKLRTAGDLAEIRTLGFRGEAVPSIASVSRFRMLTRERDAVAGTEILVDAGKVRDVKEAGCAPGTMIEAKALFYNLPARRKFMRAESTEAAHVEHQLRMHALAAPGVRFRLRRDDREVFDLPPALTALDRVRQLLGSELARELVELPRTQGKGIFVEGFVLPASHARKGRRHQFVFLNGRPVEDAVISRALAEGFRGAVAGGLHPAAWIWIDLQPVLVDVNVHPAKREVRFHRPTDVRDTILESVMTGLKKAPVSIAEENSVPARTVASIATGQPASIGVFPATRATQRMFAETPHPGTRAAVAVTPAASRPQFRLLGLLHHRLVLLESEDGLVLFDPRAAQDRIVYEKLLRQKDGVSETQGLLVPVLLELDPRDFELVMRERTTLQNCGIELEAFGGNTVQVRSLPAALQVEHPRSFLGALLDEFLHDATPGPRFAFERLARLLAKRAAGMVTPNLGEVHLVLDELFSCELPYCTSDGRPTLSEFGMRELDRRFGNTGP